MNSFSSDPSPPWSGEGLLCKLFLSYAWTIPSHPAKLRVFRVLARRCFPHGLPVRDQSGARLLADPLDYIGHAICFAGNFEPLSLSLARRLVSSGGIFLDLGANCGVFTCSLAVIPGVQCIAVDASALAIVNLQRNLQRNPDLAVTVVNVALASRRSIACLETPEFRNLGTTRIVTTTSGRPGSSHVVATMRLDELLAGLCVGSIKLLKIDVEGSELEVFYGLDSRSPYWPENIIMEYNERVARNTNDLTTCFDLLCRKGYEPLTVTGERFNPAQPLPEENLWWHRS